MSDVSRLDTPHLTPPIAELRPRSHRPDQRVDRPVPRDRPRYLLWQTVAVIVWICLNLFAVTLRWDPYPFILLNLAFSTQAAYAAPLILLAQNGQENRDGVALEDDRRRAEQTKADTEFLAWSWPRCASPSVRSPPGLPAPRTRRGPGDAGQDAAPKQKGPKGRGQSAGTKKRPRGPTRRGPPRRSRHEDHRGDDGRCVPVRPRTMYGDGVHSIG